MQAIDPHAQQTTIEADETLPTIVSIMGSKDALVKVSPERIRNEVEKGAWDVQVLDPILGPHSRSLLLCLMGTQIDVMSRAKGNVYGIFSDITGLAQSMVARGADPLWKDNDGCDSLDQAFACANLDLLKEWSRGLSVEDISQRLHGSGLPWLHKACDKAEIGIVQFLLYHGVDVNQPTATGETPLFLASSVEVVQLLLSHGADPEYRNDEGVDARVFWARPKALTQAEQMAMASKLPPPSKDRPRQTQVNDFYATAKTAGKSVLAKQIKVLGLRPDETDRRGLGLIGNLGQRLLDPKSNADGVVGLKTSNWVETVAGMQEFLDAASEKDWMSLWVGASRYGSLKAIQKQFNMLCLPIAKDPDFWIRCIGRVNEHAPSLAYGKGIDMLRQVASVMPEVLRALERQGVVSEELNRSFVRTQLLVADKKYAQNNQKFVQEQQNALLGLIRQAPALKLHETEEAWHLALTLEQPSYSTKNDNMFNPALANVLLEKGVNIPAGAIALAQSQMGEANSNTVDALVEFQAGLLQQKTNQAPQAPRRSPRL
jgi:hypothetical protein